MELPDVRTVDLSGPISYREWDGPADASYVLVHGLGASHLSWVQVGEGLSELGRVYAIDLPGFGTTPLDGRGATLMEQRKQVSAFLGWVGAERIVLCGNSLGGAISILQAAVEPASVQGLVLTNSVFPWRLGAIPHPLVMTAFGIYATPRLGERIVGWRLRRMSPEQMVRISLRVLAADPRSIPDDVVELLVEQARARRDDPDAARTFLEACRSMLRLGRRPSVSRRALGNVSCPVLLVHGGRDRLVPERFARAELAQHPDWRGRFLPDLGHVPQMEAPDRWLTEVVDWSATTFG